MFLIRKTKMFLLACVVCRMMFYILYYITYLNYLLCRISHGVFVTWLPINSMSSVKLLVLIPPSNLSYPFILIIRHSSVGQKPHAC